MGSGGKLAVVAALVGTCLALPARAATLIPSAPRGNAIPIVGPNVNMIGTADEIETDESCSPGKQTPQNETTIAVNPEDPDNIVAGANDYRIISPETGRHDAAGGVYRSTDGGETWEVGFLPGLVRGNTEAPGPYEAAGDPAVVSGPDDTFWYANIAFDRDHSRSSVAVSRSTDGGATWTTTFVVRSNDFTFHDKEWIAADPNDPDVAYVVWARFGTTGLTSDIVLSKTSDAGATWSAPKLLSVAPLNQGALIAVDDLGFVHVVYAVAPLTAYPLVHLLSVDGGETFVTKPIAAGLPGMASAGFRMPWYLGGLSADGPRLHLVVASLNGPTADIIYLRSIDHGLAWLPPLAISRAEKDQFFPWVTARGDTVLASWYELQKNDIVSYHAAASADGGLTWSEQVEVSPPFDAALTNRFRAPLCELFIGDYTAIAIGSDGIAHTMWADGRIGNETSTSADLDPYTATLTL